MSEEVRQSSSSSSSSVSLIRRKHSIFISAPPPASPTPRDEARAMQAYGYLVLGPGPGPGPGPTSSFDGFTFAHSKWPFPTPTCRTRRPLTASAAPNHYDLLGVSQDATSADIKRAYRLLALKYHPDVNKEAGASEDFKSIRVAYEILVDETSRTDYDKILHCQKSTKPLGDELDIDPECNNGLRFYRWAYLRRKMGREKRRGQYHGKKEQFSSFDDASEVSDEENSFEHRDSFIEVLRSTFISLFLVHTVGIQMSLVFSSLMAFIDRKLDAGYKLGYLFAWMLGGRAGILLTMFLSFASWASGKTSSSVVALVVAAMWFGSNLARYAPLPQGALLTLLYMSIKLQVDLT